MYTTTIAATAGIVVLVLGVVMFYLKAARARSALLKSVSDALGCSFHGNSFRGRFRSRAVRGDSGEVIERSSGSSKDRRFDGLVVSMVYGAMMAARAIRDALRSSAANPNTVRLRVELIAPDLAQPDAASAAVAARRLLKQKTGDTSLYDVATLQGTELAVLLRAGAADPATARDVVDAAISASMPSPDTAAS